MQIVLTHTLQLLEILQVAGTLLNVDFSLDCGSFDQISVLCQTICVRVSFLVETSVFFVAT